MHLNLKYNTMKTKQTMVLFSLSTKRVIEGNEDMCTMTQYNNDLTIIGRIIHTAPITQKQMSESFSNISINDWEVTSLEALGLDDL